MIDRVIVGVDHDLYCKTSDGKQFPIYTKTYSEDGNKTIMVDLTVHNGYFIQDLITITLDPLLLMYFWDCLNSHVADQQPITLEPLTYYGIQ